MSNARTHSTNSGSFVHADHPEHRTDMRPSHQQAPLPSTSYLQQERYRNAAPGPPPPPLPPLPAPSRQHRTPQPIRGQLQLQQLTMNHRPYENSHPPPPTAKLSSRPQQAESFHPPSTTRAITDLAAVPASSSRPLPPPPPRSHSRARLGVNPVPNPSGSDRPVAPSGGGYQNTQRSQFWETVLNREDSKHPSPATPWNRTTTPGASPHSAHPTTAPPLPHGASAVLNHQPPGSHRAQSDIGAPLPHRASPSPASSSSTATTTAATTTTTTTTTAAAATADKGVGGGPDRYMKAPFAGGVARNGNYTYESSPSNTRPSLNNDANTTNNNNNNNHNNSNDNSERNGGSGPSKKTWRCQFCDAVVMSRFDLRTHITLEHKNKAVLHGYPCKDKECDKVFGHRSSRCRHERMHHGK